MLTIMTCSRSMLSVTLATSSAASCSAAVGLAASQSMRMIADSAACGAKHSHSQMAHNRAVNPAQY